MEETLELYEELDIPFGSKSANPPICPQPIEQFGAHLKFKEDEEGWKAKTEAC